MALAISNKFCKPWSHQAVKEIVIHYIVIQLFYFVHVLLQIPHPLKKIIVIIQWMIWWDSCETHNINVKREGELNFNDFHSYLSFGN